MAQPSSKRIITESALATFRTEQNATFATPALVDQKVASTASPNRGLGAVQASQQTLLTGPASDAGWTVKTTAGDGATAWPYAAGVLSAPALAANATVAIRPEILRHGRIGVLLRTRDDATAGYYAGLVVRDLGQHKIIVLVQDGQGGAARAVSAWTLDNGNFDVALMGWTNLSANGIADTASTETWTDIETEVLGDVLRIWINGKRVGGDLTIPAVLNAAGPFGFFASQNRQITADFKALRVHSFDTRTISPSFTKGLALGSSQTNGYGLTTPATESYRTVLANALQSRLTGAPVVIANGGYNGDYTGQMLVRLPALLTTNSPQFVVFEVSCNDTTIQAGAPTVAQTILDVAAITSKIIAAGAIPIMLTSAPYNAAALTGGYGPNSWAKQAETNGLARQWAAENDVLVVDLIRAFDADYTATNLQADNLHWNATANTKVANAIADVMLSAKRV